jgi:hypothetical protein
MIKYFLYVLCKVNRKDLLSFFNVLIVTFTKTNLFAYGMFQFEVNFHFCETIVTSVYKIYRKKITMWFFSTGLFPLVGY